MDEHSKRREDYRAKHSSLNLTRNQAFTTPNRGQKGSMVKRIIGMIALLAVCFATGWGAHLYFTVHHAIDTAGGNKNTATSARIASKQPISVLVLGVDQGIEGRHEQGNSDTLILATLNPSTKKATMTSIPRDTLADIKGDPGNKYFMFRVNSAYQVGGNQAAVKTVSDLVNVPINYYVEVNMKALSSLVNAVGGVDVNVPFSFTYDWCSFHKGKQHLGGKHAVAYVRMRHDDPRGDYGRQMRQRQVIEAVAKKAMSVNTVSNYRKLVDIFNKYVKTNLSFGDMFSLAMNYRDCAHNLKSGYLQGHDAWINGSSIQVASTKQLQKVSNLARNNLGLGHETISNEETRQNHLNEVNNHIDWSDPTAFTNYQVYDADSDTTSGSSDSTDQSSQSSAQSSSSDNNWFDKLFK